MKRGQPWMAALPWSVLWEPHIRRVFMVLYPFVLELGWVWPFMFTAGALFFTQVSGPDPLYWRSFSNTDPLMLYFHQRAHWTDFSNHHFLDLASIALLCFGLAAWCARVQKTSMWRWGIFATYGAVLAWGAHEGIWWLVYWAFWRPSPIVFSGIGEILVVSMVILTWPLRLYVPKRFLLFMSLFYLVWAAFGFPITISYGGNTSLYGDLAANAWEVGSWASCCLAFFLLERDGMLGWWERVKYTALHGQLS